MRETDAENHQERMADDAMSIETGRGERQGDQEEVSQGKIEPLTSRKEVQGANRRINLWHEWTEEGIALVEM